MLELAGLSVAMGNAADAVKAIAQHVTATNVDDGAADAIEKHVLRYFS
jgi:hydroxymethylpyrimidine pyrophosphatase-like HAD family hydrolase